VNVRGNRSVFYIRLGLEICSKGVCDIADDMINRRPHRWDEQVEPNANVA